MTPREEARVRHVAILAGIARQVYEQHRQPPTFGRKVYGLKFRSGTGAGGELRTGSNSPLHRTPAPKVSP